MEKDCYCGDPCAYEDHQDEHGPCWGPISVIDEVYTEDDYWWIHACKGHENIWDGGDYIYPPPKAS